jgi:phage N-6-adenine-methyltransferase
VSNNSGDNEWFTPELYIEAARRVMGGIDLDPASDPLANETVRAGRFYTREDNGLTQPWFGRVWMNPPYRRGQDKDSVYPFAVRMADAVANDEVEQAIVLVNGAIETAWFHIMGEVASAICLVRKRIKFWHPDKPEADSPLQGQVFLYFGADLKAFRDEFTEFGWVLEPSA